MAKVREQGREAAKINTCLLQEFGIADGECIFESSTGQAEEQLSCCRPPIPEVHPRSMVCSRSGVRLYAATPRSGPGGPLCGSTLRVSQAARQRWLLGVAGIFFFIFLECCGMNSFFLVTQSFSPHRSLVNFLKIHFLKKYSRSTRHFFWHFLRLK